MTAYYNEFNPKSAAALRALIEDGFVADGIVDERDLKDVTPEDLKGFTQHHFFAGVGGWSIALRLAGWPDNRPVWTGSCPCQDYSDNGKQEGMEGERDMWPVWFDLMRGYAGRVESLPEVFGEQVENAISFGWFDRMRVDLEMARHAVGMAVLPACSVNAPHRRYRLGFAAYPAGAGLQARAGGEIHPSRQVNRPERLCGGNVGDVEGERFGEAGHGVGQSVERPAWADSGIVVNGVSTGLERFGRHVDGTGRRAVTPRPTSASGLWDNSRWVMCGDGKARRIPSTESDIQLLAYGFPERIGLLHAAGNAIVPEQWARFIVAAEEARKDLLTMTP